MSQSKISFPQPLTEKYRPRLVGDFIGLHRPRKILEAFLKRPFEAAFLFVGASGVGKTTLALAMAEELRAELHIVPSRACDLEAVDKLAHACSFIGFNFTTGKPCPWHLCLIDECDSMSIAAQQALLSKLDATAAIPRTIWVFTCNSTATLEPRFLSRCRVLPFEKDTLEGELEDYLRCIYRKSHGTYPLSFDMIAKQSNWNVRDALCKLEIELMLGADRSDLPPDKDIQIVEEHTHNCKQCHKPWKHADPMCELPFRHLCPPCGGTVSVGQERAKKAWVTIRTKIAAEIKASSKKRKTST